MALLFADSFDHYVTADMNKKWDAINGPVIHTIGARRGTTCLYTTNYSNYVEKNIIPGTDTLIAGASVLLGSSPAFFGSKQVLMRYLNGTTPQVDLHCNPSGTLGISRNGTTLADSTKAVIAGQLNYIEWKVQIANATGIICSIRVNGEEWLSLAAGADTQNDTVATVNRIRVGQVTSPPSSNAVSFDDFYLCDSSGSSCNDFLGDVRIDAYLPNADGANSGLTPSTGTSHYALVDEAAPNTTDYNESSTVGAKDTYGMVDMSHTPVSVFAVQLNVAAHKDDAGARSLKTVVRSGGTDYVNGTAEVLATSQRYYREIRQLDPATGAAWTKTNLNAAEFGAEVA